MRGLVMIMRANPIPTNMVRVVCRFNFRAFSSFSLTIPSQTTRRGFLQGVGVGGTAAILSPSLNQALSYQSPNERPVFATIGLRNQGWEITNKSFKFADFAAFADVDSKVLGANIEKAEKKQGRKPDAYKDYRKILDRKDINAVMIARRFPEPCN